jgi:MFS family permease
MSVAAADAGRARGGLLLQLAVAGLALTALHASRPMVTYRALDLGADPLEIGLVQSAFSILPVFTAVALGRWVDRLGEWRFMLAAMLMMSSASLLATVAGSLPELAATQALMGFGQVINVVAGQAMIANRAARTEREHHYGWYATVVSIGQLAGPAIGALLAGSALGASLAAGGPFEGNHQAVVFLFAGVSAGFAALAAVRLRGGRPGGASRPVDEPTAGMARDAWRVLRRPGMAAAMIISLTVISSIDVLVAYLPAYGEVTGLSVATVGLLLSIRAGSSLVSRFFMASLIARVGRQRLLTATMAMSGAGLLLLPFTGSIPLLIGLMLVIGFGLGLGQPMTIAWVANRSPRHERALALGVRVTGNRAALVSVPTAMGALAGAAGIAGVWLALAAFLGAGALVASRTPFDDLPASPTRGATEAVVPTEPA